MNNFRWGAALLKVLLVLMMLALLGGILYTSRSRTASRRQELLDKREEYQNEIQENISSNTFTVHDTEVVSQPGAQKSAADVVSGQVKGAVLVTPERYKRNVRLTSFSDTLDGSGVAELQRFNEEVDPEDLLVLQFTAYTQSGNVDLQVMVGKEVTDQKLLLKDEKIPGVYLANVNISANPTTFYIPMTGFEEAITVLKMKSTSPWQGVTLDSLYLVNYGKKADTAQLKIGAYADTQTEAQLLNECSLSLETASHVLMDDNVMYVSASGHLSAYALGSETPTLLSQVDDLGLTGEMAILGNTLVLCAKGNGLFLIDISDPSALTQISHYDTLEAVSGLCVSGQYAFLSSGYSGVEVVDLTDPAAPRFVTAFPVEVEDALPSAVLDCFIDGQYLYVAAKEAMSVSVYRVEDVRRPEEIAVISLDGTCQSLTVADGILYAATGYDSRNDTENPWSFGVGSGNGMEIIDVSDPENPTHLSTEKISGRYNLPSADTFDVEVFGNYAILSAMRNGLYLYDVSDKTSPKLLQRNVFSQDMPQTTSMEDSYLLNYSTAEQSRSSILDTVVGSGVLYTVVEGQGVYRVPFAGAAAPAVSQTSSFSESEAIEYLPDAPGYSVSKFAFDGTVFAAAATDYTKISGIKNRIYLACGDQGVIVLDTDLNQVGQYKADGSVQDVKLYNKYLYLAKGRDGVEITSISGNTLAKAVRISLPEGQYASSLAVVGDGKYLVVQTGMDSHMVIDIQSTGNCKFVEVDGNTVFRGTGAMTGRSIVSGAINGSYTGIYGEKGIYLYSITKAGLIQLLVENSASVLGSGSMASTGSRGIVSGETGYVTFSVGTMGLSNLKEVATPGSGEVTGKLAYAENLLVNTQSNTGKVSILDVTSITEPLLMAEFTVQGNPDLAFVSQKVVLIPCRRGGLLKLDNLKLAEVDRW